jgi:glycosyltransferase involved in cell wall biosynthesis
VLSGVDRLLFTTRARADAWLGSGALPDMERVVEVFETSSPFTPGDAPPLPGAPALLHLGRLDPVKDPLTTLAAFRRLLVNLPEAHLHMAWRDAPLLGPVRDAARDLPVTLLGPRMDTEVLLRGADLLVQASTREVCGIAVLEALATGTAPVLSDIPPFRRLTDEGRVGRLFPVGDPDAMAAAIAEAWAARQAGPLSEEALTEAVEAAYLGLGAVVGGVGRALKGSA